MTLLLWIAGIVAVVAAYTAAVHWARQPQRVEKVMLVTFTLMMAGLVVMLVGAVPGEIIPSFTGGAQNIDWPPRSHPTDPGGLNLTVGPLLFMEVGGWLVIALLTPIALGSLDAYESRHSRARRAKVRAAMEQANSR